MVDANNVTIIGVPLDLGAESLGVDIGPEAFRQKKMVEKLQHAGLKIEDTGNIPSTEREKLEAGDPTMPYAAEILRVNSEVADTVNKSVQKGSKALVIGGDHSVNLGAFSGASVALEGQLGLIYIDAHGDINTPETSISHNIHGMHLAALMGFGPPQFVNFYHPGQKLAKQNLLHIGGNDLDQAEWDLVKHERLHFFTMLDLLSDGIGPLLKMVDELSEKVHNIWVSVDLDAIDSVYAPGVGIPNRGGLTYREVAAITEYIGKKCRVVGVDVVEYNPLKDSDGITADLGIELAAKLFGKDYSWYTNYMDRNSDTGAFAQENFSS